MILYSTGYRKLDMECEVPFNPRLIAFSLRMFSGSVADGITCLLIITTLQVGSEIVRRALSYPLKLIAKNAGVNGSVVVEKVCNQSTVFQVSAI